MQQFENLVDAMREFISEYDLLPDSEQTKLRRTLYQQYGGFAQAFFKEDLDESCIETFMNTMRYDGPMVPRWVIECSQDHKGYFFLAHDAERATRVGEKLGFCTIHRVPFGNAFINDWSARSIKMGKPLPSDWSIKAGETVYVDGFPYEPNIDTTAGAIRDFTSKNAVICASK